MLFASQTNPQPLYRQVVEQIRARILSRDLTPGTPLPSVRQLAAQISASVITTRRGYLELEREGLITTRPDLGTFVAQISGQRRKEVAMGMLREELERLAASARELGVPPQELVDLCERSWPPRTTRKCAPPTASGKQGCPPAGRIGGREA